MCIRQSLFHRISTPARTRTQKRSVRKTDLAAGEVLELDYYGSSGDQAWSSRRPWPEREQQGRAHSALVRGPRPRSSLHATCAQDHDNKAHPSLLHYRLLVPVKKAGAVIGKVQIILLGAMGRVQAAYWAPKQFL